MVHSIWTSSGTNFSFWNLCNYIMDYNAITSHNISLDKVWKLAGSARAVRQTTHWNTTLATKFLKYNFGWGDHEHTDACLLIDRVLSITSVFPHGFKALVPIANLFLCPKYLKKQFPRNSSPTNCHLRSQTSVLLSMNFSEIESDQKFLRVEKSLNRSRWAGIQSRSIYNKVLET